MLRPFQLSTTQFTQSIWRLWKTFPSTKMRTKLRLQVVIECNENPKNIEQRKERKWERNTNITLLELPSYGASMQSAHM